MQLERSFQRGASLAWSAATASGCSFRCRRHIPQSRGRGGDLLSSHVQRAELRPLDRQARQNGSATCLPGCARPHSTLRPSNPRLTYAGRCSQVCLLASLLRRRVIVLMGGNRGEARLDSGTRALDSGEMRHGALGGDEGPPPQQAVSHGSQSAQSAQAPLPRSVR